MRVSEPFENEEYKIMGNDFYFINMSSYHDIIWVIFLCEFE